MHEVARHEIGSRVSWDVAHLQRLRVTPRKGEKERCTSRANRVAIWPMKSSRLSSCGRGEWPTAARRLEMKEC